MEGGQELRSCLSFPPCAGDWIFRAARSGFRGPAAGLPCGVGARGSLALEINPWMKLMSMGVVA